jgi:hypothetical protein
MPKLMLFQDEFFFSVEFENVRMRLMFSNFLVRLRLKEVEEVSDGVTVGEENNELIHSNFSKGGLFFKFEQKFQKSYKNPSTSTFLKFSFP